MRTEDWWPPSGNDLALGGNQLRVAEYLPFLNLFNTPEVFLGMSRVPCQVLKKRQMCKLPPHVYR